MTRVAASRRLRQLRPTTAAVLAAAAFCGALTNSSPAAEDRAASAPGGQGWMVEYAVTAVSAPLGEGGATDAPAGHSRVQIHGRSAFEVDHDQKAAFHIRNVRFRQQASSRGPDGGQDTYRFAGSGTLRGSGQMHTNRLTLTLEWRAGAGTGDRSGQPITEPLLAASWSSEWTLKPTTKRVKFGSGEWMERPAFAGARLMTVDNPLKGGQPLQLLEALEIYQLPRADLQVTIGDQPASDRGARTLHVSVKNLGPEDSPPAELIVLLPPGLRVADRKLPVEAIGAYSLLTFPLVNLKSGAGTSFAIAVVAAPEADPAADEPDVPPVARVSGRGYDPQPGNNGAFLLVERQP